MRRMLLPLLCVLMTVISCAPSRHAVHLEMRYPSKSGVDLAGKILSVVYIENKDSLTTAFNGAMAQGFADVLEEDYATGDGSVGVFRMPAQSGAEYATRDSMLSLLGDTGSDVVFLLDSLKTDSPFTPGIISTFTVTLHCFDAMDQTEEVQTFTGNTFAYHDQGEAKGAALADSFKAQWKNEQYSFMYFDSEKWYKPLDKVEQYDWKGAMELWFGLLSSNDLMKRSCAEYNIAVCCYLSGEYELASEWLDRSDADSKLPSSDGLRKRIDARR